MKKTTSFLSVVTLFVLIILACTNKEINLITNVKLEFTQTTINTGVINELIPATFTITPEAILPEFVYYFQYDVLEGEGVFLTTEEETLPAGKPNVLVLEEGASNFVLDLNYQPTTPGNHRVQVTASDNFDKSFSAILTYNIENLNILWNATSNVTSVELGDLVPITITLQNNSDDPEVTFQRRYRFEESEGTLEDLEETPILLNNFVEILPGTYRINAIANQIGTTRINFDLRDSNGQELTSSISFDVTQKILSDEAEIIDFTINNRAGVINENTITITLPPETNVTALIPIITTSENATITPENNTAQDLSEPVIYTVTAENGTSTNEYTVMVNIEEIPDTEAPVITLNGDANIDILVNTEYIEQGAIATDNIDEIFDVTDITGTVDVTTTGTYIITYNAVDQANNSAESVTRTVNVVDGTAPIITLNGANPLNIAFGETYIEPGATAIDNVDGTFDVPTSGISGTVDTNTVGQYTVTYNVSDSNNNAATEVTRTVNVVDGTAPIITLNGANPLNIAFGETYIEPGATAIDNVDGTFDVPTSGISGTVDTNAVGQYTVTYNVSDSNNNAATEVTRTVNVVDGTAPIITLNGANPLNIAFGETYIEPGATATDDVDGTFNVPTSGISGTVDTNTIGQYTVTYNVSDSNNNAATEVTRTVNVQDRIAPIITLNGENPLNIDAGTPYNEPGATVTDNVDGTFDLPISGISGNVDTNTPGQYTVEYNISDSSNNDATEVVRIVNVAEVFPTSVTISTAPFEIDLNSGETITVSAEILPENTTNKMITWSSSDENILRVDQNGNITAIAVGEADIIATSDSNAMIVDNVRVTVYLGVTGVSINNTDPQNISISASTAITATITPMDARNGNLIWTSSDTNVISLSEDSLENVLAIPNNPGTAIVTVRTEDGDFTDTITVNVITNEPFLDLETGAYYGTPGSIIPYSLNGGGRGGGSLTVTIRSSANPDSMLIDEQSISWGNRDGENANYNFTVPASGFVFFSAIMTNASDNATFTLDDVAVIELGDGTDADSGIFINGTVFPKE